MAHFIGLMSGTSLDGIDGVLAETGAEDQPLQSRSHVHHGFPPELRAELLALNHSGADELHRAALACEALAHCYAEVVHALLQQHGLEAKAVRAIGAHGQTVRHRPGAAVGTTDGYTLQLMNGAMLAELTQIDVVCDFRSRDVAAGGQGAPLVPAFHAASFHVPGQAQAVLNLGGIANLTLLASTGEVRGFDTGPANALMDFWCQRHTGQAMDSDGRWAAQGRIDEDLLTACLAEPFFALPPPKSTGRDLFNPAWLEARLADGVHRKPVDVMATLAALTVRSVADGLRRLAPATQALYVCGGGAFNGHVLAGLRGALTSMTVESTAELGIAPDQVEALAFAWLAQACLERRPGNLPAVTGARGLRVLGAIYPCA